MTKKKSYDKIIKLLFYNGKKAKYVNSMHHGGLSRRRRSTTKRIRLPLGNRAASRYSPYSQVHTEVYIGFADQPRSVFACLWATEPLLNTLRTHKFIRRYISASPINHEAYSLAFGQPSRFSILSVLTSSYGGISKRS